MIITLQIHGDKYTAETQTDDADADEAVEIFTRLLVTAGYPPSAIKLAEGGTYECEYKEEQR